MHITKEWCTSAAEREEGHEVGVGEPRDQCESCQGNGEVITDWETYLEPPMGTDPEAGVSICPDCHGTGWVCPDGDPASPTLNKSMRK